MQGETGEGDGALVGEEVGSEGLEGSGGSEGSEGPEVSEESSGVATLSSLTPTKKPINPETPSRATKINIFQNFGLARLLLRFWAGPSDWMLSDVNRGRGMVGKASRGVDKGGLAQDNS